MRSEEGELFCLLANLRVGTGTTAHFTSAPSTLQELEKEPLILPSKNGDFTLFLPNLWSV